VEKPPILEYQTPRKPSVLRRHVAKLGLWLGIINVILGMGCFELIRPIRGTLPEMILFLGWQFAAIFCGVLYIVGSRLVLTPNRSWETALLIGSALHVVIVLSLAVFAICASIIWPIGPGPLFSGFYLAHALSQGRLLDQIRKLRRET
jgi:hypothetical protein